MKILRFSPLGNLDSSMGRIFAFIILHLAITATAVSADDAGDTSSHLPPLMIHDDEILAGKNPTNLTCVGTRPITWTYKDHDGSTEKLEGDGHNKPGREGYTHASSIMINMDDNFPGHYYCHYRDADIENSNHSASTYVYLYSEYVGFAVDNQTPDNLFPSSGDDVFLDCRPTHPNLTVVVRRNGEVIHNDTLKDPRKGFVIENAKETGTSKVRYECTIQASNGRIYHNEFFVKVRERYNAPWVNIRENTYNVVGHDMEVSCQVADQHFGKEPKFFWTYPTYDNNRVTSETVYGPDSNNDFFYTNYLKIHNVTLKNSGTYECKVNVSGYRATRKMITILETQDSYVNVTPKQLNVFLKAGDRLQEKLKILYFPPGDLLFQSEGKFSLKKSEKDTFTFELGLDEVKLEDFGTYDLSFTTPDGKASREFLLNLMVESKTVLVLERLFESVTEGQNLTLVCTATGYPLENITWAYQSCLRGECSGSFSNMKTQETTSISYNQSMRNKYTSEVTFAANEDAKVECRSGNEVKEVEIVILEFGREYLFSYSENSNDEMPIQKFTTNLTLAETFEFGLTCKASKFYFKKLDILSPLDKEESREDNGDKAHDSNFSFKESLIISSLNKSHEGTYSCIATYRNDSETLQKNLKLSVDDFIPVRFDNDSNMKPEGSEKEKMSRGSFILNCLVSGTPPFVFNWTKDGKPLPPSLKKINESTIEIQNLDSEAHSGLYECHASNWGGHTVKGSLTLQVKDNDGSKAVNIIIGIIIPCFIVLVGMIILLILRVRREALKRRQQKNFAVRFQRGCLFELNPDLTADEQAYLLPYDHKWEVTRDRIHLGQLLGSGAFGRVVKAEVSNLEPGVPTTTAAVKMCKSQGEASQVRALELELKILIHLGKHLNIVNLLGAHTSMVSDGELWILVEYCRYGNLLHFLHRHRHLFVDVIDPVTDSINWSIMEGHCTTSSFSPASIKSPDRKNSLRSPKSPAPQPPPSPTPSEKECYNTGYTVTTSVSTDDSNLSISSQAPTSHLVGKSGTTDTASEGGGRKVSPPSIFRYDSSCKLMKNVRMVENPAYHKVPGNEKQSSSPPLVEDSSGSEHKTVTKKKSLMAQESQGTTFLHEKSTIPGVTSSFLTTDLICWAWQVAEGMDYLARRKILHGDLAVRNLLLAEHNVIKISDFGLSRDIYKDDVYKKQTEEKMPFKWMSVEAIRDRIFSTQSDVWAFGVTMWELFSLGGTPYPDLNIDNAFCQTLQNGYRMEKPFTSNQEIYTIMLHCWELEPKNRPDFRTLADSLSNMLMPETTRHYNTKNDEYLISNEERFKNETDYLEMMSPPIFGTHSRDEVNLQNNSFEDSGYLPMSPTARTPKEFDISSPSDQPKKQVFTPDEEQGRGNVNPFQRPLEKILERESDSLLHFNSCYKENEALTHI